MLRWLRRRLAWYIAGPELTELERWRTSTIEAAHLLPQLPTAAAAIDYIERRAYAIDLWHDR